ncbi:MAG: response regulator [Aliarcobacter sp.]|nr:response regulator [Aliarcobacter sp.]MDD2887728.1 response regulator [Aliarcobacter sp.]
MPKIKILIVEDESIVALDIKRILTTLQYEVTDMASDYFSAIKSVQENRPDIILMDVNLGKGKDGIQTVKEIQLNYDIPVIYITAYGDENTINRAVATNPMGYLLKPFKKDEIRSIILLTLYKLNQINDFNKNTNHHNLGSNYYYDLDNEILFYKNNPLKLSIKEKKLLTILVEAKGQIVSFRELEYMLWPDAPICDSTLRTLIYRLRTKLEYKIIETISSIGCKIISP